MQIYRGDIQNKITKIHNIQGTEQISIYVSFNQWYS